MAERLIQLQNIHKEYGSKTVLEDLNLYVKDKEFVTLLGPSGCGKTTTLRIIGGFESPDSGTVLFEGKDITDVPPHQRQVNTVFQRYALFPHLNVYDNIAFGLRIAKKSERTIHITFTCIWAVMVVLEVVKILWETYCGKTVSFEWTGILPLYPCSLYMYAMPFAIWGKGNVQKAACGYVCTLGLMGACINFFYPMTVLPTYSCIHFAGMHTFVFHGTMLFTCLVMLISGYHRYTYVTDWKQMFLASIPALIQSVPANIVNYTIGADYMFFKGDSAFLPAIFGNVPDPVTTVIIYVLYVFVPAMFYLPSFLTQKRKGLHAKVR